MKRLLISIVILLFCKSYDAAAQTPFTLLTKDSIINKYSLEENWLFTEEDDTAFAAAGYDDSKWKLVNTPRLTTHTGKKNHFIFKGKGWLRLHLYIDSSVSGIPLCIAMVHYGASEVYLDGKEIASYGTIGDKENSDYYNPNGIPLIINAPPGMHVIAIRYANYNALFNNKFHNEPDAGILIHLGKANDFVQYTVRASNLTTTVSIFVSTFFLSFFLLHLFLFLYNKKERANLYFSIFCLSLGIIFFAPYLRYSLNVPLATLGVYHVLIIAISASCLALSGFLNELFGGNKLRSTIIAFLSLLSVAIWFFYHLAGGIICFLLVVTVSIEAVVLIIRALIRRVKGAFIVGIGILSLTLIFLISFIVIISMQMNFNLGTDFGLILMFIILSIPVSMSIYLSRNYSLINNSLAHQLQEVEKLSEKNMQQELEKQRLLENRKEELEKEVESRTSELTAQKEKSDDLLRNILPEEVAEELKEKGTSAAKYFDHVSVLFTDFVDFTKAGERLTPQQLVDELHTCFKKFDEICTKYDIEKIKTIGDAYLAVSGLPVADNQHAINITKAAIEIREFIAKRKLSQPETSFNIRIGIHSGSVVAGIVGVKKFAYDIWGDTVNTAARMEQSSELGKINISQFTYELIKDRFNCTFRGKITAKNKGELNMYFVEGEI